MLQVRHTRESITVEYQGMGPTTPIEESIPVGLGHPGRQKKGPRVRCWGKKKALPGNGEAEGGLRGFARHAWPTPRLDDEVVRLNVEYRVRQ
jgi:hypothetical protein